MFEQIAHPHKRAFLAAYSECGNVKEAAEIAGISREAHYDWKRSDPEYAAAFAEASELAADALEDEARKRATAGGSDKVLMFLLKGLKQERYGTRHVEHSGELKHRHSVDFSAYSDEELDALERLLSKAGSADHAGGDRG